MKKFTYVFLALAVIVLMAGCATKEPTVIKSQIYPTRYADLNSFPASQYELIGNITGEGSFDASDWMWTAEIPPCGEITLDENSSIFYRKNINSSVSAFGKAMDAALFEMESKADELGAAFLILPRYACEVVKEKVTIKVTAIGVKLLDKSGNDLQTF